jgi:hypothetical protein
MSLLTNDYSSYKTQKLKKKRKERDKQVAVVDVDISVRPPLLTAS